MKAEVAPKMDTDFVTGENPKQVRCERQMDLHFHTQDVLPRKILFSHVKRLLRYISSTCFLLLNGRHGTSNSRPNL